MKDNKRILILSIISVLILIATVVSISYAYFKNNIDNNDANVNVNTEITNDIKVLFTSNDKIELLYAEPGAKKEIEFSVSLSAPKNESDEIDYGLLWNITENNFEYEVDNINDPQLVYSLYYSEDKETWSTYIENADCTTWIGTKNIADNLKLAANPNETKTIYFKFVLEYKSYDYNQATNMSKTFKGVISLDEEGI